MRIGELARRAGVSTRALRHYEELGLLRAGRSANGYRVYTDADLRAVAEIRTLVGLGLTLEETRPFVECLRAGHPTGGSCRDSIAVYRRKIAEVDVSLARLAEIRAELAAELDAQRRHARSPLRAEPRRGHRRGGPGPGRTCMSTTNAATQIGRVGIVGEVTDATFDAEVLRSPVPVLMEFTAAWCPPCRMLAPVLREFAAEHAGRLRVVALDVDADPRVAAAEGVLGMPTLRLYVGGEVLAQVVGARSKRALAETVLGALERR